MSKKSGLGKLLAGVGIGVGLGVLLAPKSGEETREDLKKKIDEFIEEAKKIDVNEVKNEFINKVNDLKAELEDLDKEKAISLAKTKGNELKLKASELVDLAKEKGTPVLENTANELRKKAIDVTKQVLKKLEDKDYYRVHE